MAIADTPNLTQLLVLLSHPRRRFVLYSLQGRERRIGTDELARDIATWEADYPVGGPTESAVDAVTASLHHTHFPKLIEADLLVYNAARDHVECGERTVATRLLDDELRLERRRALSTER